MRNYHTTLAASRLGIHHVAMMDAADAAADAVDRVISRAWKQALAVLSQNFGPRRNYIRALLAIGQLQDAIPRTLAQQFRRVYVRGRKGAGAALASALPMKVLRQVSPLPAEVIESELREDLFSGGMIEITPEGVTSRQPAKRKRSATKERAIYEDLIFPGPTEDEVLGVLSPFIRPNDWQGIGQTRRKMPQELADEIAKGIASGLTQAQLAKQLLPYYEGHKARARTVARTFSMAVAQRASQDANDKLGDLCIGFQIHATRDSHTRPHHAARDGTIYYKDPKGNQKGLDQMPRPPFEADGTLAFNCFLPGQYVSGPITKVLKAWYSGDAFEIRTASGSRSFITANHPVLTEDGFTFARQLKKGQYLWANKMRKEMFGGRYKHNRPALIEDVFRSLHSIRNTKHSTPFDFYGDGKFIKGDIRIVGADRLVRSERNFEESQKRRHLNFQLPDDGIMGRSNLSGPLFRSHGGPLQSLSLAGASRRNSHLYQSATNGSPHDSKMRGTPVFRHPLVDVERPQGGIVQINAPLESESTQRAIYGLAANAEVLSAFRNAPTFVDIEFLDLFKRQVDSFHDRVTEVRAFRYEGPIYDVESATGVFLLNAEQGTMTLQKNCRCYLSPVLRPLEAFIEDPSKLARFETAMEKVIPDPVDYSRWFDQASERQKQQAVGPVRYRTLKARLPATREPQYADFLDQEGGNLVPVDQLKAETPQQQQARRADVDQLIAKRQRQIKQVARLGFETPPPPVQRPLPEPMPAPQIEVAPLAPEMQSPALAQALRMLASQPEFLTAWQQDVDRILRQANPVPAEYLIPGGAGALRVMAELLAQELAPSGDPARMQLGKWFKRAAGVLRGMI